MNESDRYKQIKKSNKPKVSIQNLETFTYFSYNGFNYTQYEHMGFIMNSAILTTDSNKDLKLLLEIAKKLNIKVKLLTKEQQEELGLYRAIKEGRTQEFVDTDKFLQKLKK